MQKIGYFSCLAAVGMLGILTATEPQLTEKKIKFEGVKYRIVRVPPKKLELAWKNDRGVPMRSFAAVQKHYRQKDRKVTLMMNAGIFEPGGIPSGLHVQQGRVLQPINLRSGKGNFYLQPNGVFSIVNKKSTISTSIKYNQIHASNKKGKTTETPRLALQSGPLLLANGKIHPAFNRNSKYLLRRNGIGIDSRGNVVLVITDYKAEKVGKTDKINGVNLHGFARLFIHLGCKNALFLDGDLSQMIVNPPQKTDSNLFGAILVVTEPASAK